MKISIITAVLNNMSTVAEALDSILMQKGVDVEMIVVDGGSTDGTLEILENYRHLLSALVVERDGGVYEALNKGIARATGEIVGFLHSDDMFDNDSVLHQIASTFTDTTIDAVYGDLLYVSKENPSHERRYWRAGMFTKSKLRRGWMPPHPTFYVRRSVYLRLGSFDTSYRIAADYECVLRLLGNGAVRAAYIPHVLIRMRVGGISNRSIKNIFLKSCEDYRALRSTGVGGAFSLVWKNLSKLPQFLSRDRTA